jgi:alpha/beta superfamily hydrolase
MSEKRIAIRVPGSSIDALLHEAPGDRAVVVTHPHPLYGGDMYNNVVSAIVEAYSEADFTTLRFNFRGIGQSPTTYDQAEEGKADVQAALDYLYEMGKTAIDLAGYSFGSWINAIGLDGFERANRLVLVSPPVAFLDFSEVMPSEKIKHVITGSDDEIAPHSQLEPIVHHWNSNALLKTIEGADHFYFGDTGRVRAIIREFLL